MAEAKANKRVNDDLVEALRGIVGDRLSTTDAVLGHHGRDETYHTPHPPDVVVFPEATEEVSRIVSLCAEREIPVIPFGTGTSLEGHVAALNGGVCIDLTRMNEVIRVNA